MGRRTDIWTYLIITAVTVAIWWHAVRETLTNATITLTTVDFVVKSDRAWQVEPDKAREVKVTVRGPAKWVEEVERDLSTLEIELGANAGEQKIVLADSMQSHSKFERLAVTKTDPVDITLQLDPIVGDDVRVTIDLPDGLHTVESVVEAVPSTVTLAMPSRLRDKIKGELRVIAKIERDQIRNLEEGKLHTLELSLRIRDEDGFREDEGMILSPLKVTVAFTIASKTSEHPLGYPVRIQLAGPPEDSEFQVEFEPKQLRGVTVSGGRDVIGSIQSGEAVVVALVHLRTADKDAKVDEPFQKRVTQFWALGPDFASTIDASVKTEDGGDESRPLIGVTIHRRAEE